MNEEEATHYMLKSLAEHGRVVAEYGQALQDLHDMMKATQDAPYVAKRALTELGELRGAVADSLKLTVLWANHSLKVGQREISREAYLSPRTVNTWVNSVTADQLTSAIRKLAGKHPRDLKLLQP